MSRISLTVFLLLRSASLVSAGDRHAVFTEILHDSVHDGTVDYQRLKADRRLLEYCHYLAGIDPGSLTDDHERLALWINAYNAYTLKVVAEHYPIGSISELHAGSLKLATLLKTTVWDRSLAVVNHTSLTLNTIEHEIVRRQFHEPRAHFALVCASRSCPPLRPEAYEGNRLDEQLNDQGRLFVGDPFRNSFTLDARIASISSIFDWFAADFGASREAVLSFIAQFASPPIAASLRSDPRRWKVRYKPYDWSLNGKR